MDSTQPVTTSCPCPIRASTQLPATEENLSKGNLDTHLLPAVLGHAPVVFNQDLAVPGELQQALPWQGLSRQVPGQPGPNTPLLHGIHLLLVKGMYAGGGNCIDSPEVISMGLLLMIGMLAMILDSRTALQGASQGVELCLTAVIPSLLPFLCLSMALTQRLFSKRLPLFGVIGRLFGIPKGAEILLLPALLGGYPAGAACIAQAANRGALRKRDAEILLGFCSLPGPAFLFGLVARQFSNVLAGAALWALVLLSAWAVSRNPSGQERTGGGGTGGVCRPNHPGRGGHGKNLHNGDPFSGGAELFAHLSSVGRRCIGGGRGPVGADKRLLPFAECSVRTGPLPFGGRAHCLWRGLRGAPDRPGLPGA